MRTLLSSSWVIGDIVDWFDISLLDSVQRNQWEEENIVKREDLDIGFQMVRHSCSDVGTSHLIVPY